jgi:hypothetical protein
MPTSDERGSDCRTMVVVLTVATTGAGRSSLARAAGAAAASAIDIAAKTACILTKAILSERR